jgi:IS30 family transposase
LDLRDRIQIDIGVMTNESLHSIGRRPGRPASTIKREIDINGVAPSRNGQKSGYRRKEAFGARQSGRSAEVGYDALRAQAAPMRGRAEPNRASWP